MPVWILLALQYIPTVIQVGKQVVEFLKTPFNKKIDVTVSDQVEEKNETKP